MVVVVGEVVEEIVEGLAERRRVTAVQVARSFCQKGALPLGISKHRLCIDFAWSLH